MVIPEASGIAGHALALLRDATAGTKYEGRLYLVGGALRDRYLNVPHGADLDLVLEGNAVELALLLHQNGLSSHYPVLYPRFGTAMIHLVVDFAGVDIELVTARSESYHPDSRKPDVRPGTLREDIFRRDFTINTLAQNLHTGELLDITGRAFQDLDAGIICTPVEPQITFFDDPLRMLRAIRIAARFGFTIEKATWAAIQAETRRLRPPTIARERIREEFIKIAMLPGKQFRRGIELLAESGLLVEFLPEMLSMIEASHSDNGRRESWLRTLLSLGAVPGDAPLEARLALLWHDIGGLSTQSGSGSGVVRTIMTRLKFANDQVRSVVDLVTNRTRLTEYNPGWEDPAVKRLIRDTHVFLDQLFSLTKCRLAVEEFSECRTQTLLDLRSRIDSMIEVADIESPLDGAEIMRILGVGPGKHLQDAKDFLLNAVLDDRLRDDDVIAVTEMLVNWWQTASLNYDV